MDIKQFGGWDLPIHEHHEQIKRIGTMLQINAKDVKFDSENETVCITGTGGVYQATLDHCTCPDFEFRQQPCKHIYYLARELGCLNNLPKIDRKASKAFKESVPIEIEHYKQLFFDGAISIEKFKKIVNALLAKG